MGNRAEKASGYPSYSTSKVDKAGFRLGLAGKLISTAVIGLGIGGAAEACGGGNDTSSNTGQNTETPILPTPSPLIESPTPIITEAPTPAPTPETNPYGIAPTFEDLSISVNPILQTYITKENENIVKETFINCNEQDLPSEDSIKAMGSRYDIFVIDQCGSLYQRLSQTYQENPLPEIKETLDKLLSFTLGHNGKVDDLNRRGKLTLGSNIGSTTEEYKSFFYNKYFSPK